MDPLRANAVHSLALVAASLCIGDLNLFLLRSMREGWDHICNSDSSYCIDYGRPDCLVLKGSILAYRRSALCFGLCCGPWASHISHLSRVPISKMGLIIYLNGGL